MSEASGINSPVLDEEAPILEPATPRRLPILGDTSMSRAIREICDEWGFGRWLMDKAYGPNGMMYGLSRARDSNADALCEAFDIHQDPSITSINDALDWVTQLDLRIEEQRPSYEEEVIDWENHLGMERDYYLMILATFSRRYIIHRLKERGFKLTKNTKLDAHDRCAWVELPRPEAGGVYFVVAGEREERVKIGCAKNIRKRVAELQTSSPYRLRLAAFLLCDDPPKEEANNHKKFAAYRLHGEWFSLSGELLDEVRRLRVAADAFAGSRGAVETSQLRATRRAHAMQLRN